MNISFLFGRHQSSISEPDSSCNKDTAGDPGPPFRRQSFAETGLLDIHHAAGRVLFGNFQNQIADRDSRADAVSQVDAADFEIGPPHRPRNFEPEVAAGVFPSLCADHRHLAPGLPTVAVTVNPRVSGNQRLVD